MLTARTFLVNVPRAQLINEIFRDYIYHCKEEYEIEIDVDVETEGEDEPYKVIDEDTIDEFKFRISNDYENGWDIGEFIENQYYLNGDFMEIDYEIMRKNVYDYVVDNLYAANALSLMGYMNERKGVFRVIFLMEVEHTNYDFEPYYTIYNPKCYCVKKYDEDYCCVCLENRKNYRTGCGHFVCVVCNENLKVKCPICRSKKSNECKTCSGLVVREIFTKRTYPKTPINLP
jgi:hypothetical protein